MTRADYGLLVLIFVLAALTGYLLSVGLRGIDLSVIQIMAGG